MRVLTNFGFHLRLASCVILFFNINFLSVPCFSESQNSQIYIKVNDPNVKKSLLALPTFQFLGTPSIAKNYLKAGKDLFDVVYFDLGVSSLFEFLSPQGFIEDTSKVGLRPAPGETGGFNFESWRQIKTDFLIRAGYKIIGNDITLETYLYYVPQAKLVLGKTYKGKIQDLRLIGHTYANDIVKELTGKKGIFLTKIMASRSTNPGQKEIFIMDFDGTNQQQVTHHQSISISPSWSADGQSIAYTSFALHATAKLKKRNTDIYTYDLGTKKRYVVSYHDGLNSGASFFPDGNLVITSSKNGNPDLYKISIEGKQLKQLTNGPRNSMNVEPVVSADGKHLAFSSDRSGKPMIHVMDLNTNEVHRRTLAGVFNSTPSWSPDGKKIAFAGQDQNHFDIFVMNADGSDIVRLTDAKKPNGTPASNDTPTFSPDGQHILFTSNRTGNYQLYIVSLDGGNERQITFDKFNYFSPKWSPYLE